MKHGFVKVAAGTPSIRVADCAHNGGEALRLMQEAAALGAKILVLPELCLTGATCGDLFFQPTLLDGAEQALARLVAESETTDLLTVIGLPVRGAWSADVYNCAAVLHRGQVLALIPKRHLSAGERRWFTAGEEGCGTVRLLGASCPLTPTLLVCPALKELAVGVEIGDDLFSLTPPSQTMAAAGATLTLNPAAAPALAGSAGRIRRCVAEHSARLMCGYVRAGAGEGESTTDLVFDGQRIIGENGAVLAEDRFSCGLTLSEVDVSRLAACRRGSDRFLSANPDKSWVRLPFHPDITDTVLTRPISPSPFFPEEKEAQAERCEELLRIAALGLKKRLEHTHAPCAVVGLSGGLDSTLAILTVAAAFDQMCKSRRDILAVTMPCFGTTARTRSNAELLAEELGATLRVIDIGDAVRQHFSDIGHDMNDHSVTFENAQARERTQVLMDVANQAGGLVIGTGDLSELALGWATYNGDHMSMYSVNGSIPKTLMRHLVSHVAGREGGRLAEVLRDILDTPVSPELLPPRDGEIAQRTEDLVGPYELHDFYLYYAIGRACPPGKVLRLAEYALGDRYDRATLLKWLNNFYRRFFSQQFKRSCLPDGPKVGALTLSPRGDWAMPSDAVSALWLAELEALT